MQVWELMCDEAESERTSQSTWVDTCTQSTLNQEIVYVAGSVMALVVALPLLDPMKQDLNEDVAHHTTGSGIFGATGIMAVRVQPSVNDNYIESDLAD